jgi:amidophosphoribosyltransferase
MPEPRKLDLPDNDRQIVERILKARVPDRPVYAFGSRTQGRARRRSDLDLAVGGSQELPLASRADLAEDFTESDLPIFVDMVDLNAVDETFRSRIERDFVPIQRVSGAGTNPRLRSETWGTQILADDKRADVDVDDDDETPFDKLREECGVMAVYNHPDAARLTYWGLYALQHRGQESAGIASADGCNVNDIKGMGLVSEIFKDDVLLQLPGHMAIGHSRYSTTGDSALLNAQPISVESTKGLIAIAHNGNLTNLGNSKERLERDGAIFQTTSDSEIIIQLIAHSKETTLVDCIADSLSQVDGAFSIVMMTRNRIFAARDPHGFRPLSMGRIAGVDGAPDTFVFASETCAFDLLHAKYERDVLPGELVMVSEDGVTSRYFNTDEKQASCVFEHVYFARPDSRIYGRWVQQSREEMGRTLARESAVAADLIVPVPDSGVTAAIGYASESGIPFNLGLIRNHYVGRTFIQPEQRVRDFGVRMKLNPVRSLLEGKRVVLVDDSIIRGTTSRKIVRMVRAAGAKEVHMRISCPPTISPCFYGVDTPSTKDLIAANNTVAQICAFIEADSLAYLSHDGLIHSCTKGEPAGGLTKDSFCTACYTGVYPTQVVDVTEILPAPQAVAV